jgi:outer membrane protein assembly factor BamB
MGKHFFRLISSRINRRCVFILTTWDEMILQKLKDQEILSLMAKRAMIISAIFAALLSALLLVNYLQMRVSAPLRSPALNQLMLQLQSEPDNQALKEQIRALDLLARKAFFTHQWQLRTGSFILFVTVLLFLISLKYLRSQQPLLPDLSTEAPSEESWEMRFFSSRLILWGGLGLFALAFVAGILAENQFKTKSSEATNASFPTLEELQQNWPTFRGPEGAGHAYVTDAPTVWNDSTGDGILWKVEAPLPGFNSPIVWGDKIFMSGADEKTQEVYGFDAATGALLWTTPLNDVPDHPSEPPKVSDDTGYAAPTMATDGQHLFVLFATVDIACLDLDGKRLWAKNLGHPENHYGHSSSLFIYKDLLLVQYDQADTRRLLALRAGNGKIEYQIKRDDVQISWASPLLIMGGRDEVVLSSNPFVISYAPATGKELWRVKCMDGEVAPSPAYAAGRVFVVNEYARLAAIQINNSAEKIWEYEDDLSEVSSPLATDSLLIMASSYGSVTCLNAATGEKFWIHEFDKGFYSSPILVGNLVYLMDTNGVMNIFKASSSFESVAANELGEKAVTIPAFMPGRIYIRGVEHLYCIGR